MLEPLKQALGDRIVMYFVCTTIHDTRMPSMDFIGPEPGKTSYVHEIAMEHRARICKMFYMGWPACTTDYLLDDLSQHFRNEWMDQGGGAYIVLVDRAGTIAYADYHQDIPPHWGPEAVDFPYEFLTIRMNHLESRLASFFSCGGLYDRTIETGYPPWRLSGQRDPDAEAPPIDHGVWMPARVVAVDATRRLVRVERTLPPAHRMKGLRFWDEAGERAVAFDPAVKTRLETLRAWLGDSREEPVYTLSIGDSTDIFINGWSKPFNDVRTGDRVGVLYRADPGNPEDVKPLQIRVYRFR
jgi:hypothetical protein